MLDEEELVKTLKTNPMYQRALALLSTDAEKKHVESTATKVMLDMFKAMRPMLAKAVAEENEQNMADIDPTKVVNEKTGQAISPDPTTTKVNDGDQ